MRLQVGVLVFLWEASSGLRGLFGALWEEFLSWSTAQHASDRVVRAGGRLQAADTCHLGCHGGVPFRCKRVGATGITDDVRSAVLIPAHLICLGFTVLGWDPTSSDSTMWTLQAG